MRISPSNLKRAEHCLHWARPETPLTYSPMGEAAITGVQTGARIERALTGRSSEVEPDDKADELFEVWLARYGQPKGWRAETAFAWDPIKDTVRVLGDGLDRRKRASMLRPGEMQATLDAFDPETNTVYDWKTGGQWDTPPAHSNPQLAAYARCVAKAFGLSQVRVVLSHITDSGVYESEHTYDAWDLDIEIPGKVRALVDGIPTAQPKPGSGCKWCPALLSCPGPRQVAEELGKSPNLRLPIVDATHAARVFEALEVVDELAEAARAAVKAFVDASGTVALSDGRRYGIVETTVEGIDGDAALPVLQKLIGDAAPCFEIKVTKSAITKATEIVAGKGPKRAQFEREIYAALNAANAVTSKSVMRHQILRGK